MRADQYSKVKLKDGTEGTVIEVFGDCEAYMVEFPTPDGEHAYDNIIVKADEVAEIC